MAKTLRVCFISTEMAGIGAYGGFGVLTRDLACALAERGVDVFVVMPRKDGQRPIEYLNGVTVVSFPGPLYVGVRSMLPFAGVFKMIDADVYHSQEPTVGTRVAQLAEPRKKHIVTFQDPRTIVDWRKQWTTNPLGRWQELKFLLKYQLQVGRGVRAAHARYCQAKYIIDKAMRIYRLSDRPGFLPNPVQMPSQEITKAPCPTVCFVGRWDAIKRPELFIELATRFPRVEFVLAGACLGDPSRDAEIRTLCAATPNVVVPGWVDAERRSRLLNRSWVLVNTSTKECLPVSYLEAGAHKCAILSHGNADEFASSFGYWAQKGDLDDYVRGLNFLLEGDHWRECGERGQEYVRNTHECANVIDQHLRVYQEAIER